jgi:CRP/FNR family transcriptional regulator, cyclic AMP receptor protein
VTATPACRYAGIGDDMSVHETGDDQGFWGLLTEDDQAALSEIGRTRVFLPGTTMCAEGEAATDVFVLVHGWVKILSADRDGRELVFALRGHGDVIGEIAGATTGYRTATIQAVDTLRALIISYERFSSFLDSHPGAGRAYRQMIARRWNEAESMMLSRSVSSGAQRLAAVLLGLADSPGDGQDGEVHVTMPLSQAELASVAGTSRATVTRVFTIWRRRGILRTSQRGITISDPTALRRIASSPATSISETA